MNCNTAALPPITRDGLTIDAQRHTITVRGGLGCEGAIGLDVDNDNITLLGLRIGPNSVSRFDHGIVLGEMGPVDKVTIAKSTSEPCVVGDAASGNYLDQGRTNITVRDCFVGVDPTISQISAREGSA